VLQRAERIQQEAQNGFQRLSSKLKSKLLKPEKPQQALLGGYLVRPSPPSLPRRSQA